MNLQTCRGVTEASELSHMYVHIIEQVHQCGLKHSFLHVQAQTTVPQHSLTARAAQDTWHSESTGLCAPALSPAGGQCMPLNDVPQKPDRSLEVALPKKRDVLNRTFYIIVLRVWRSWVLLLLPFLLRQAV